MFREGFLRLDVEVMDGLRLAPGYNFDLVQIGGNASIYTLLSSSCRSWKVWQACVHKKGLLGRAVTCMKVVYLSGYIKLMGKCVQ